MLPVVILDDGSTRGNLANPHVSRTSNPVGIGEAAQNRLLNGGGEAIVLLLRGFVHELHTLWQRSAGD
jgi:hypothetical protein